MKAGTTEIEVDTRVTLKGIRGDDAVLNGVTGRVTHPFAFGCTDKNWIGIYSDEPTIYGDSFNVHKSEVEIIK
ncbi:MAG: hypothetical protein ABI091_03300 [Ferruginibacter sp.]